MFNNRQYHHSHLNNNMLRTAMLRAGRTVASRGPMTGTIVVSLKLKDLLVTLLKQYTARTGATYAMATRSMVTNARAASKRCVLSIQL